jgi:hypothetical protein
LKKRPGRLTTKPMSAVSGALYGLAARDQVSFVFTGAGFNSVT